MKTIELKTLIRWSILYSTGSIFILLLLFTIIKPFKSFDIYEVTQRNFYENFKEKENELVNFMDFYKSSLLELGTTHEMFNFIIKKDNKKLLEKLFLHNKKSLPDVFQIRYLDKNGFEKIRVDGDAIAIFNNDAKSEIVEDSRLQDKSQKAYFKKFIKLNPMEIGYSKIDLNKDFGKITTPKMITIRIAMAIYGNNKKPEGVLIYNISLNRVLLNFTNSSLYKISLINNDGHFLFHYNSRIGLLGESESYKLSDEFPIYHKDILKYDNFKNKTIYSRITKKFNKDEKIKILLESKYKANNFYVYAYFIFVLCVILFFPTLIYFLLKGKVL